MKHAVRIGHRALLALATLVLLVSVAGGSAAQARSEGGNDRRYYDDHRCRARDWDRRYRDDHYHHGKHKKNKKHKGHERYDYYDRGYHGSHYSDRRPHFTVPHHLYHRDYRTYDRYYRGFTYYAPHRHSHRVYLFPVIVDGYYTEYRPYAYCGEAYYPDHYWYGGSRGRSGLHFDY